MIHTKYANLTNQKVMDKLTQLMAKKENGRYYFTDPAEVNDIFQEVKNRIETLDHIQNHPWIPVEQQLPPLVEDWDVDMVSKQVIVLLQNGEVSKDQYWKDKKTDEGGWAYNSIAVTHWMPFFEPQKGGQQ